MGLSRSTFYDAPSVVLAPDDVLVRIKAICDEFECYGYRRVGAALRHQEVSEARKFRSAPSRSPLSESTQPLRRRISA
jgi:hypothetical protein